VKGSGPFSFIS